ncbi:MAG: hypothetical protein K6G12_09865 [Lachnospiraceae bacterium]|nr:hypothetical protein [Lachnospiraceae bacterium]
MDRKTTYNDIGIKNDLDRDRIRKLFIIGLLAGIMVLIGDMLLGWGVSDNSLSGLAKELSSYDDISDGRIIWSAMLGFIGIPLEGLCYFGIYRLIAPYSEKYAHMLRSGIIGYIAFGGCGVHVPCLAVVYYYNRMMSMCPDEAVSNTLSFGLYFLLPGTIAFFIFFIVLSIAQITAFAKGYTPYPRWCWIFSLPVGMAAAMLLKFAGNHAIANALTAGWISIGNIWMFGGLLVMMRKAFGLTDTYNIRY